MCVHGSIAGIGIMTSRALEGLLSPSTHLGEKDVTSVPQGQKCSRKIEAEKRKVESKACRRDLKSEEEGGGPQAPLQKLP